MGLDMYIYERERETKVLGKEMIYWRKANQIHGWMERNVCAGECENCEEYVITKDQLIHLRNTCQQVLDSVLTKTAHHYNEYDMPVLDEEIADTSMCEHLLPPCVGFFFGCYDYDQWYLDDLFRTIQDIDTVLEDYDYDDPGSEYELIYYAWW